MIKKLRGTGWLLLLFFMQVPGTHIVFSQNFTQVVRGIVTDADSRKPLTGVNIVCETCNPKIGCSSDSTGRFRLVVPVGRQNFSITHVGYNLKSISDVLIGTGKEVLLNVELEERTIVTQEIAVKGVARRWMNPMATVSVRSLRSQDAARYAGGYFDPLRMVANFAGVASGNSDENNEIIVRGNSPRGLLWRIEGIEIPNPNHFSNGQGASGGGYSSITTNVLSSFDFFTGSFPAEYGNAYSGVMDLNLRNGNTEKSEYSLGLSVLGAEGSAEGPLNKRGTISYLADFRRADFQFLANAGIIDTEDLDIVPSTFDWAFKTTLKTAKTGTFDLFSMGGTSTAGDRASASGGDIKTGGDNDEYIEQNKSAVAGLKHSILFSNQKTFLRTTAGFTYENSTDQDRTVDTLLNRTVTYLDHYTYPAVRVATLVNHKFNASHSLRAGAYFNQVWGDLFAKRLNGAKYDTLISSTARGWYSGYYLQWKYKENNAFETNTGFHFFHSGITREFLVEPRFGIKFYVAQNQSLNFGTGLHSRLEPLSVYSYRVRISGKKREESNAGLKTIKAFHFTAGYSINFLNDFNFNLEAYSQALYDIPVSISPSSQYSIINSSYGLPDLIMVNSGKSKNQGIEATLEKSFSHNYYFMLNLSVFDSKYKAPDMRWYNTYYNTNYVNNILGGKEFPFGKYDQHVIGFRIRSMMRGGLRYTPPDFAQSIRSKKLVYTAAANYSENLPGFKRIDFGATYRLNRKNYAWVFLFDALNVLNRKNVERRRFEYKNNQVLTYDSKTMGIIPVITVKAEF